MDKNEEHFVLEKTKYNIGDEIFENDFCKNIYSIYGLGIYYHKTLEPAFYYDIDTGQLNGSYIIRSPNGEINGIYDCSYGVTNEIFCRDYEDIAYRED